MFSRKCLTVISCSQQGVSIMIQTDKDHRHRNMHDTPGPILRVASWNLNLFALFKSIKLVRTSLWARVTQHKQVRGGRGQQQRWRQGRGEHNLPPTVSRTFWWATGGRDDQQERERERETVTVRERETDTHISITSASWSSSDLIG